MGSALTPFEHGVSAHGGGMLHRRTVWVEQRFNYTTKHGLPCPAYDMVLLTYSTNWSLSQYIYPVVFLPYMH